MRYADLLEEAIPPIFGSWSAEELISRASQDFIAGNSMEEFARIFDILSEFGTLTKYTNLDGGAYISYDNSNGIMFMANYTSDAVFEGGRANIKLTLNQQNGRWEIINFSVNTAL